MDGKLFISLEFKESGGRAKAVLSAAFCARCDSAQGKSCTPKKKKGGEKFYTTRSRSPSPSHTQSVPLLYKLFYELARRSINITNYILIKFSLQKGFSINIIARRLLLLTPDFTGYLVWSFCVTCQTPFALTPLLLLWHSFNCLLRNYGFILLFAFRDFFLSSSLGTHKY